MRHGDDGEGAREPLDLRLATGAAVAWLAAAWSLSGGPARPLVIALAASGAGGALLLRHRRWRAAPALALTCFCVALVLLPLSARLARGKESALVRLADARRPATLELTVAADPRTLAAKGLAGQPRVLVETSADVLVLAGRRVAVEGTVNVLGDLSGWRSVLPGQRVRLNGTLQRDLDGGYLAVTLSARAPPVALGTPPWWQRLAGRIRSSLRAAVQGLPAEERGLLPGLVDGDTAGLDPVLAEHFRSAGLTHLVAVSGTNCSIVVGAVLLLLRRLRARPRVSALAGGAVLAMFVVVARPSPSVLRAAAMAAISLVALASGRPRSAVPGLAAATLALLVWDPTLAASASFLMSVGATAALLLIAPGWARALRRRRVPIGLAESLAVAAAAHAVTAPVVAAISGRVSLAAIPANLLAEPMVAPVTVLGFLAAVVAPLWLAPASLLALAAGWPCRWLVAVGERFGQLTSATVPWPGGVAGGAALVAVLIVVWVSALATGVRRAFVAAAATAIAVLVPVRAATSGWPPTGWFFTACDVGQGDALVLRAGDDAGVLVDAGPDPVPVDRCLHELGIRQLPLVVLTHLHADHIGGLSGAFRGRRVGRIVTGPLAEPATGLRALRSAAEPRALRPAVPVVGSRFAVGAVQLEVLGPRSAYRGTRSDPNNSSLVVRAVVDGVRVLLPGDAEIEAQQDLLRTGVDLHADVLKVAHHGSAYFDPAFLAAVHPSAAVISVGAHNDYGHPSPRLLHALERLGVPTRRTDRDGDVAFAGGPGRLRAVVHGPAASVADGRMAACQPGRSPRTTSPFPCPASCWSWGTRNCSSSGRSAPSPRRPAAPTPRWWKPP